MNLVVNNHNVFLIVFVTFLVSVLLVPIVKKVAKQMPEKSIRFQCQGLED